MSKYVDLAINAIIRPPRHQYNIESLPSSIFVPNYGMIERHSISFTNSRGLKVIGSFFSPKEIIPEMSCVTYLHGNASSQLEGLFLVKIFIPAGVSVLCFDFSGCGLSEGEYISLGYFERNDVECAINFVRNTFGVGRVALWGRSMGAVTSLFAMSDDPTIAGAVLDSPFSSLPILIKEIAENQNIPGFLASTASWYIGKKIKELVKFDIDKVEPIKVVQSCFTPVLFIHGQEDDFILPHHSDDLFKEYIGEDKQKMIVSGNHNSERSIDVQITAILFLARTLDALIIIDDIENTLSGRNNNISHFSNFNDMLNHF